MLKWCLRNRVQNRIVNEFSKKVYRIFNGLTFKRSNVKDFFVFLSHIY